MLRNIYNHIADYKTIHPIRFWVFFIGVILLLALSVYLIRKIYKGYKKRALLKQSVSPETVTVRKEAATNFLKNYKVLLGVVIGQTLVIIGLVALLLTYSSPSAERMENPSISSSEYLFGIDVSHYQGGINWIEMRTSHHPIEYVFIRATMGIDGKDLRFKENWANANHNNYIRGAYHYYRPNENSTQQFENYAKSVTLIPGDFIPILDIEKESRFGMENLRAGVLNWLKLAEEKYGVKPMVYTGLQFYRDNLKGHIDDYPLWIAAYSGKHRVKGVDWHFHQFTEKVIVKGIKTSVDGNDFIGSREELNNLLLK